MYSATGRIEEAFDYLEKLHALTDAPGDWADYCLNIGGDAMIVGDFEFAVGFYKSAVEVEPSHPQAWGLLGYSLYQLGEFKEAEINLRRAIQIDPSNRLANKALQKVEKALESHLGPAKRSVAAANRKTRDHRERGQLLKIRVEQYSFRIKLVFTTDPKGADGQ